MVSGCEDIFFYVGMDMSIKPLKVAFLDRDGVVNVDRGYVYRPEDLQWVPGFCDFLRELLRLRYKPVVVTNQSGVARGYFSLQQVHVFHHYIRQKLKEQGLDIEVFLVCPHHTEGSVAGYNIKCDCRKPATGLITSWLRQEKKTLNKRTSFFLGDRCSDVLCGRALGITSLQLLGKDHPPCEEAHGVVKEFSEVGPYLFPSD